MDKANVPHQLQIYSYHVACQLCVNSSWFIVPLPRTFDDGSTNEVYGAIAASGLGA